MLVISLFWVFALFFFSVCTLLISRYSEFLQCYAPYTLWRKLSYLTVWRHTWRKNWVNCAVLTGNSAGLRTVFSSRLSHRELCSSLRESHSFLSLPADTTMASSQGTSVSSNSFSRWASQDESPYKRTLFNILTTNNGHAVAQNVVAKSAYKVHRKP